MNIAHFDPSVQEAIRRTIRLNSLEDKDILGVRVRDADVLIVTRWHQTFVGQVEVDKEGRHVD